MSNINLIIGREFNERVRKKSFIIATLLMPLLMVALTLAPALIMQFSKSSLKTVEVIDDSGIIFTHLESNDEVEFLLSEQSLDQAREGREHFGVLYIGEDILTDNSNVRLYTNSASSVMLESTISQNIEEVIEAERLKEYQIENLAQIMRSVEATVSLRSIRNDVDPANEDASSAAAAMGIGYILGFILYLFLIIYGAMVMSSVIEEKGSRVLEVLVSSVRPFDLLMGKIISIALVAITQIAIWAALMFTLLIVVVPAVMPSDVMESVAALQNGGSMSAISADQSSEMVGALATLTDIGYMSQIILFAVLFLVGGYLLYSAMFAAVGSAVDTVEDAQNLQWPIMAPIMLAFFAQMLIARDPNSMVIKIFSMIPFTSPIIMIARVPHGIPLYQIIISLVLLYSSFVATVWFAAKIYRVGIFMHGKKPSLRELWRWTRYRY